jgi:hypothetical protein
VGSLPPADLATSPTNVKRIKITFSSTEEALKEFNNERQLETLAYWCKKEPEPLLIGFSGSRGRYKVRLGKKKSFMLVGMVVDHDANIKKEVFPQTFVFRAVVSL